MAYPESPARYRTHKKMCGYILLETKSICCLVLLEPIDECQTFVCATTGAVQDISKSQNYLSLQCLAILRSVLISLASLIIAEFHLVALNLLIRLTARLNAEAEAKLVF